MSKEIAITPIMALIPSGYQRQVLASIPIESLNLPNRIIRLERSPTSLAVEVVIYIPPVQGLKEGEDE